MTHSFLLALRVSRWLLSWIVVVIAASAIAYAMIGSLAEERDLRTVTQVTVPAERGPSLTVELCPPIGGGYGSYVDSLIVAESRRIACGHGA